jgi:phosphatidylserine/phosphatidylglycerophosphate/cardiolipin synthase-like enzyme/uncharacterized membrane protein YdjX (TVP38/TMEM64 family)
MLQRAFPLILRPSKNVWRVAHADRAAVLIDGGSYFGALREALRNARSSVFILGWDIDSRTRLVGEDGKADDGLPEPFVEFLSALVKRQRDLSVHILAWDYSVLYALERELFPELTLGWRTPRRVQFCLDDNLPVGASHHQKIVVVDDAVAFCGGLDVTLRRWDRRRHSLDDPARVDAAGRPYPPFHDVQAMVDGEAAHALAHYVRTRWLRGACRRPPPVSPTGDPWPRSVQPDFTHVDVGIARTQPEFDEQAPVREIEALYLDSIDHAERAIYIENQFLTCTRFAERLARRMREKPELEVVVVGPRDHDSWIPERAMRNGRIRFTRILADNGVAERVRLLHPRVRGGGRTVDTMVHSKVMVVDDVLLRIGSSNLNNRSMGLDTECDLAIEAASQDQRAAIKRMRDTLLGHHCASSAEQVASTLAKTRSLIATAETLSDDGHRLVPIDDANSGPVRWLETVDGLADPEKPIAAPAFLSQFVGMRPSASRFWRVLRIFATGLFLVALVAVWHLTPLADLTRPQEVQGWLDYAARSPRAPLFVLGAFVVGGLIAFPVLLLITATAATFGPWLGFAYAFTGTMLSALVTYAVGAKLGRGVLEDALGPRLHRIRRRITNRGVLAVAAIRLVPIAPFTLVNLVAGASRIPLQDYLLGTILGMTPGMLVLSALGFQILSIITEPTIGNMLLFLAAVTAWIALSIGVQAFVLKTRRAQS